MNEKQLLWKEKFFEESETKKNILNLITYDLAAKTSSNNYSKLKTTKTIERIRISRFLYANEIC